jgi:Flp pilus assembly protein TadD
MANSDGKQFAPYEITEKIGAGTSGEVFAARHSHTGQTVALKVLMPNVFANLEQQRRFRREAEIQASLVHAHVVQVLASGEEGGQHWVAMELIEGTTLAQKIAQEAPIPMDASLQIALKLADAVAYLHSSGLVHRGIRPQNVLLDAAGTVKLADCGLSRHHHGAILKQPDALQLLPYMAPEALAGDDGAAAADLYALGVTLYYLFTGKLPFQAETVPDLVAKIEASLPDEPAQYAPAISPALNLLILRLMQQDPAERPQASRVCDELRAERRPRISRKVGQAQDSGGVAHTSVASRSSKKIPVSGAHSGAQRTTGQRATVKQPAASAELSAGQSIAIFLVGMLVVGAAVHGMNRETAHPDQTTGPGRIFSEAEWQAKIKQHPTSAKVRLDHAVFLIGKMSDDEAERELRKAIELDPKATEAHLRLGQLLDRNHKPADAIAEYRLAAGLDPNSDKPRLMLAVALSEVGKLAEAEGIFRRLVKDHPRKTQYLHCLAECLNNQKKHKEAVTVYQQLVEIDDKDSGAHLNLGYCLEYCDRFADAQKEYERCLVLDPKNNTARQNLAGINSRRKAFE